MPAAACATSRLCGYPHTTLHVAYNRRHRVAPAGGCAASDSRRCSLLRASHCTAALAVCTWPKFTVCEALMLACTSSRTGFAPATSAPGLGSPLPHLRRDWAHACHIYAGTGLAPATSAPGLGCPVASAPSTALRFAWPRSGAMAERLFLLPAACARQLRSACARNCAPIRLLPHESIDSIE
jgi:hypothetical protein